MDRLAVKLFIYHQREGISQVATLLIGVTVLLFANSFSMKRDLPAKEEPISISFIAPPEEPKPVIEKPVEVVPPKPTKTLAPTKAPVKPQQAEPRPQQAEPQKEVPQTNNTLPVLESPVTSQDNVAMPAVSTAKQVSSPTKNEEPKSALKSNGASEGGFAQDIKARIERKKVYPDNARNLGMTGEVEVLYELDRSGNLIRAEVVTSSGHKLLDQAALKAVKSVQYGKFPDDAWIGSGSKEFRTKLVFQLN